MWTLRLNENRNVKLPTHKYKSSLKQNVLKLQNDRKIWKAARIVINHKRGHRTAERLQSAENAAANPNAKRCRGPDERAPFEEERYCLSFCSFDECDWTLRSAISFQRPRRKGGRGPACDGSPRNHGPRTENYSAEENCCLGIVIGFWCKERHDDQIWAIVLLQNNKNKGKGKETFLERFWFWPLASEAVPLEGAPPSRALTAWGRDWPAGPAGPSAT